MTARILEATDWSGIIGGREQPAAPLWLAGAERAREVPGRTGPGTFASFADRDRLRVNDDAAAADRLTVAKAVVGPDQVVVHEIACRVRNFQSERIETAARPQLAVGGSEQEGERAAP